MKPSPKKGFCRKVPKLETPSLPVILSQYFLEHLSHFCMTFLLHFFQEVFKLVWDDLLM